MIELKAWTRIAALGGDFASTQRKTLDDGSGSRFAAEFALTTRNALPLSTGSMIGTAPSPLQALRSTAAPVKAAEQSLNERALAIRAYRQEILASNIANADTPGYKAVDFDINAALRSGYSGSSKPPLQFRVPRQASADNNTVELDSERAQFAENALMYEYSVDRVRGHYKEMEDLLKNTPF
jgi:flagellar basal body rod protein FlgB